MASDPTEEALKIKATEALEALALACGARGHIFMVIKGDGGKIGGCSPSLRSYGAALMDEVEKATEKPVIVTSKREPSGLLKAEKVLHTLAKTKHVELHPIVATMIQGLNEINNHKIPRVMALTDPSTMPAWFPFPPAVYAPRAQKMDLHQLFHVMDVIFGQVRGNLPAIQTLHSMLDRVYKTGNCSIGTRAGIDSFFEFLEDEAITALGSGGAAAAVKEEAADDVIPSETSGVGGEDDGGAEPRSRKRTRDDAPGGRARGAAAAASPVCSSANNGHVLLPSLGNDEDIDFEQYLSEEGGRDLAELDSAFGQWPQAQPYWDQQHSHVPAVGVDAPPSDISVAFESDVRVGEGQRWEFGQSGQSTMVTGSDPRLHANAAFQVAYGNGVGNGDRNGNPQLTPTSNWTPPWFAPDGGDAYPAKEPLLGNDEAVVRARLQQQMLLAEQLAQEGGQNRGNPYPRARPLSRNDGLSDSMRRDFMLTHNDEYARPVGMEPRMRPVGIAMARAPSFSPAGTPSVELAPPPVERSSSAPAAVVSSPKPPGLLQKALGRGRGAPKFAATGGPPKPLKPRSGELSKGSPSAIPPAILPQAIPQQALMPGKEPGPLDRPRSGEQPHPVRPSEPPDWIERKSSSGLGLEESPVGRPSLREGDPAHLTGESARSAGESSGKALKILGLEAHGTFGSDGSSSQWSGSQHGSGNFDDQSENGSGKKGIAGLFSRFGRSKNKGEEGQSVKSTGVTRNVGPQKPNPPGPFQPGVYRAEAWQGYVSTGGVFAGGMAPKPIGGPGASPRIGRVDGLPATQGTYPPAAGGDLYSSRQGGSGQPLPPGSIPPVAAGDRSSPRQGASGLPGMPASFPPVAGVSLSSPRRGDSGQPLPQGSIPPEDCEAFPLHRDIQHFDSFKSDGSLLVGDPEPEECESFPFQRPSPPSEGIQRLMQRLSVTEDVHTAPKQAPADGGKRLGEKFDNEPSPTSILKEGGPFVGAYSPLSARGSTGGAAYAAGGIAYDDEEDDDIPGSPGFALGIGTGDEVDFDDDTHVVQGAFGDAPLTSAGPNGNNGSVKVVNRTAGVHAMPAIPVAKAATGTFGGTGLPGAVPAVAVVVPGGKVPARAPGGPVEERDDVFDRLQRLRVGATA